MSNKKLSEVLKETTNNIKTMQELRRVSGYYVTEFYIDGPQIVDEIETQIFDFYDYKITPKREAVIKKAVDNYVKALVSAYKSNSFIHKKSGFKSASITVIEATKESYIVQIEG